MREVYIVAEDEVTVSVLKRLVNDYTRNLVVKGVRPARGGKLKSMIASFNKLSVTNPIILLSDLDTEDCAPLAKAKLLKNELQNPDFIINIAVDEAEAWLYADRDGMASYFKIAKAEIPESSVQKMGGMMPRLEVNVPIKTSLHLTTNLIKKSSDKALVQKVMSRDSRSKGPLYNSAIIPFIENIWNPENARAGSYSLDGTIKRIQDLDNRS